MRVIKQTVSSSILNAPVLIGPENKFFVRLDSFEGNNVNLFVLLHTLGPNDWINITNTNGAAKVAGDFVQCGAYKNNLPEQCSIRPIATGTYTSAEATIVVGDLPEDRII